MALYKVTIWKTFCFGYLRYLLLQPQRVEYINWVVTFSQFSSSQRQIHIFFPFSSPLWIKRPQAQEKRETLLLNGIFVSKFVKSSHSVNLIIFGVMVIQQARIFVNAHKQREFRRSSFLREKRVNDYAQMVKNNGKLTSSFMTSTP